MAVERIDFSLVHGDEEMFPRPYPASKDVPEWFKALPSEAQAPDMPVRTVKNCPPFMEALTCGYIIPLAADITLSLDAAGVFHGQGPSYQEPGRSGKFVDVHRSDQYQGAPFEKCPVVKILNPWLIRTPPGISTLFLPPLNRFGVHLFPLAGLVETDLFYREVNFPAVLTIPRGSTLTLKRGTPFVQAIPIKRDEYESQVVPLNAEEYKTGRPVTLPDNHELYAETLNYYKNNFWRKKAYR